MITNFLKTTPLPMVIGMLLVMGASSMVTAQKRDESKQDSRPQKTSQPKEQRQRIYQQQQTQNQQRFDQRQQKYQQTQQQRQIQNPSGPTRVQQEQPRIENKQQSQNQLASNQRQIKSKERQQIQVQQQQWRQSEQGWQSAYNSRWPSQQNLYNQRAQLLQQQRRPEQLVFQQAYWERVREDQARLQNWRSYNDIALNYSYFRGGRYYYTSEYGTTLLLDAVNDGYQEGFLAGQSDREDGWKNDYRNAFAYQDASYGYNGYWIGLDEYQYYFRQGFQRGYDDGYHNRYEFGSYTNGTYLMLGGILKGIIDFSLIAG